MADLDLVVSVSRDDLGLEPLQLAPGSRYFIGTQFLGGTVTWNRQKATSPFVDGEVTTQRNRLNVTEQIGIEIRASSPAELQAATVELLQAFLQDNFVLDVSVNGAHFAYQCETADYQVATWSTPRLVANRGQVLFQVPRQPVALAGGF